MHHTIVRLIQMTPLCPSSIAAPNGQTWCHPPKGNTLPNRTTKVSNGSPSQPFNDSTEYPTYESIQQLEEIGHEQQLHPSGWN